MKEYVKKRMIDRRVGLGVLMYIVLVWTVIQMSGFRKENPFYAVYNGICFENREVLQLTIRILLVGGVLYLFGYKIQEVFGERSFYLQIRSQSRLTFLYYMYQYAIYFAIAAVVISFVVAMLFGVIFGIIDGDTVVQTMREIIPYMLLHLLEILFFEGLMVLAMIWNINAAFVILLYVVMLVLYFFPAMGWMKWLPAGIASITRIDNFLWVEGSYRLNAGVAIRFMCFVDVAIFAVGIIRKKRG